MERQSDATDGEPKTLGLVRSNLITATAATATAAATARVASGWGGGAARSCSREDRKLDRCLLAGTFRASDFLRLVDHNFFKVFVAVFANIFIDRHGGKPRRSYQPKYSKNRP